MDIRTIFMVFGTVFLAELGDKTQIATLAFSMKERSMLAVFIGAASALILSSLIAVLLGDMIANAIPLHYIKISSGIIFLILGLWMLIS